MRTISVFAECVAPYSKLGSKLEPKFEPKLGGQQARQYRAFRK